MEPKSRKLGLSSNRNGPSSSLPPSSRLRRCRGPEGSGPNRRSSGTPSGCDSRPEREPPGREEEWGGGGRAGREGPPRQRGAQRASKEVTETEMLSKPAAPSAPPRPGGVGPERTPAGGRWPTRSETDENKPSPRLRGCLGAAPLRLGREARGRPGATAEPGRTPLLHA